MTLSKIKTMKKDRGFTIVELLIVIVIIAVLAAITIVAYNGITNRAKDANNKTDATSIAKVAEAINADSGSYPTGTTDATLTTSFNTASTTTKLPPGVAVKYLATAGTAPTYAAALADADLATHTYTVRVCSGANGLVIYYPKRETSTALTQTVGPGC